MASKTVFTILLGLSILATAFVWMNEESYSNLEEDNPSASFKSSGYDSNGDSLTDSVRITLTKYSGKSLDGSDISVNVSRVDYHFTSWTVGEWKIVDCSHKGLNDIIVSIDGTKYQVASVECD